MPDLQKLLPPPMRRPPKPGHPNGTNGDAPAALKNGDAPESPRTDNPGKRLSTGVKDAPADLVGWVDERMGGSTVLTAMLLRKVPKGTNWF